MDMEKLRFVASGVPTDQCDVTCGEVAALLDEIEHHRNAPGNTPVCPLCQASMDRVRFEGYYESFDYWECDCGDGDVPIDHVNRECR